MTIGPFSDTPSSELRPDSVSNDVPEVKGDMDNPITPGLRRTSEKLPSGPVSKILMQTLMRATADKSPKSYMDGDSKKVLFIVDSGASQHVVTDISILDNVVHRGWNEDFGRIRGCVPDSVTQVMGYGNISMIGKTLCAPGIMTNVLSVLQLDRNGFTVTFSKGRCTAVRNLNGVEEQIVAVAHNNKYIAEIPVRGVLSGKPEATSTKDIWAECYMLSVEEQDVNDTVLLSRTERILKDPVSTNYELVVDSGCSEHMFNTCSQLTDYRRLQDGERKVRVANGEAISVEGVGKCGILSTVYYVPLLSHSLLSVRSLTQQGVDVIFRDDYAVISPGRSNLEFEPLRATLSDNLFKIPIVQFEVNTRIPHVECFAHDPPVDKCLLISSDARNDPISYVHYMYGHPNAAKTRHICKCTSFKGIKKLEMKSFEFLKNCEFCRLAKAKRNSFKGSVSRPTVLG